MSRMRPSSAVASSNETAFILCNCQGLGFGVWGLWLGVWKVWVWGLDLGLGLEV